MSTQAMIHKHASVPAISLPAKRRGAWQLCEVAGNLRQAMLHDLLICCLAACLHDVHILTARP